MTVSPRILLCLPGAFGQNGGIETYNRLVIQAFVEFVKERGGRCEALILNDPDGSVEPEYLADGGRHPQAFGGSRRRFVQKVLSTALRVRPHLVVFGHVDFARLAPAVMTLCPAARTWFLIYGIDVWRRLSALSRFVLKGADRVVSISDFTARKVCEVNGADPRRVAVLPCALDTTWTSRFGALAREHRNGGPPTILTVARLSASEGYKGVDSVLRALPAIARELETVQYVVVGDGDDRPRLEALAAQLGVAGRVTFRGRLSREELAEAYATCTLFAMPSRGEGFGIVFLEASLFGKPSIAGDHGGAPEVVEDGQTGILVDQSDVASLARAILSLMGDREALGRMGENARKRLEEKFTYATFRQKVFSLAEETLAMTA